MEPIEGNCWNNKPAKIPGSASLLDRQKKIGHKFEASVAHQRGCLSSSGGILGTAPSSKFWIDTFGREGKGWDKASLGLGHQS